MTMELSNIIPHIEALIFASEKPLTSADIVELINNAFGFLEERVSPEQIDSCIEGIREKYASEFYPFEVRESGGGWQFLTKKEFHKTIAQLNGDKFLKRLSNAALETLAIIAYKQPITKGEVESIRGVNSDYSVQKLLEKELIIISGRNEKLPGHPLVYTTSKNFMDYFGINTTDDLPKIREVLSEQTIEATFINAKDFTSNTEIDPEEKTNPVNEAADNTVQNEVIEEILPGTAQDTTLTMTEEITVIEEEIVTNNSNEGENFVGESSLSEEDTAVSHPEENNAPKEDGIVILEGTKTGETQENTTEDSVAVSEETSGTLSGEEENASYSQSANAEADELPPSPENK